MSTQRKIINDPVFGFIHIPAGLLLDLVRHPFVQRLTRIRQLGLSPLVYPGALHTRFQHSLGAYFLMSEAVVQLTSKGNEITLPEAEAVKAAILLHDLGHGPFSHVLEHIWIKGLTHEEISLRLMQRINWEMDEKLDEAIRIFRNEHPKKFLHQLVSSHLDMDRLDYLCRDSFYTGVIEGNIGSARIIKMLDVRDDQLVVEAKGIYSIENFLTARRLMYWQVYLHKTSVACEQMLSAVIRWAQELARQGTEVFAPPAFDYFLRHAVDRERFCRNEECLEYFIQLDDSDIWTSLKVWCSHPDKILSTLSQGIINRRLFKVEVTNEPVTEARLCTLREKISRHFGIPPEEARYFYAVCNIQKDMYNPADDRIEILYNDGRRKDISEASDMFNLDVLEKKVRKYYLCYQRIE